MRKERVVAILFSVVIVVALIAALLPYYLDEARVLYSEGKKFEADTDYASAIAKYQTLVDKYPDNNYALLANESRLGDCYYNWGLVLDGEQKYSEAIEKFKQALTYEGKALQYTAEEAMLGSYFKWGQSLQNQNRFIEAVDKYQSIYEVESYYSDPNSSISIKDKITECYLQYGQLLLSQKNFSSALDSYQLIANADFSSYHYKSIAEEVIPQCYYEWVSQLVASEEYDEAIQKYCLIVENYSSSSWASLGNVSVLKEVPDDVLYTWAAKLQQEKSYDGAIRLYETLLQYNPGSQYASQAEKARIDTEIAKIAEQGHGALAPPSAVDQAELQGNLKLTIVNDTPYQLTILLSGPTTESINIQASPDSYVRSSPPSSIFSPDSIFYHAPQPPDSAKRETITLESGTYKIALKVDAPDIDPFYGEGPLIGDNEYQEWVYIINVR